MKKTKKLLAGLTISALAFSNMLSTNFALASDNLNEAERNICNILNTDSYSLYEFSINSGDFYYEINNDYYKNTQKISEEEYRKFIDYDNYAINDDKFIYLHELGSLDNQYEKEEEYGNFFKEVLELNKNYKIEGNIIYDKNTNNKIFEATNLKPNEEIKKIFRHNGNNIYYYTETKTGKYQEIEEGKREEIIDSDFYKNNEKFYSISGKNVYYGGPVSDARDYKVVIDKRNDDIYKVEHIKKENGDEDHVHYLSELNIYKNKKFLYKINTETYVGDASAPGNPVFYLFINGEDTYIFDKLGYNYTEIYKNGKALCGEKTSETPVSPTNPVTEPKKETPENGNNGNGASVNPSNPLPSNGNSPTGKDISESIKEDNRVSGNGEINKENKKEEEIKQEKQIKESISEVVKKYDINILSVVYKIVSSEKYTQKAKTNNTVKMIIDEFKKQYLSLKK